MSYKIQVLSLGGILDQAIKVVKDRFGLLFGIVAVIHIPVSLLSGLYLQSALPDPPAMSSSPEEIMAYNMEVASQLPTIAGISLLTGLVILPLANAAIVDAVAKIYLGRPASVMDSIKVAGSRLFPLILTSILVGVVVMLGFLLVIIPGILFLFWYALATHVVVLEETYYGAAMRRSKELMKGNIGDIFVLGLIVGVISYAIGALGGLIPQPQAQVVLQVLLQAVLTLFSTATLVVFYFSCRCNLENFDLEHLADSMGDGSEPEFVDTF